MKLRLLIMGLLLVSARPPGPTRDDVQRCYFITHPNESPLEVERWPTPVRGRNHFT